MSLKLEVGEFYLSASGEIIKINGSNKSLNTFLDTSDNEYEINGVCVGDMRAFDLIAHIPKELHLKLIELVNSYHTNSVYKKAVNESYRIRIKEINDKETNKTTI